MQPAHLPATFSTPTFRTTLPPSHSSPTSTSTSTPSSPTPHPVTAIPSPALQFAQRRNRILQQHLTSLERHINQALSAAVATDDDVSDAGGGDGGGGGGEERRRRRRLVCELLMPLLVRTEGYKRLEGLARPAGGAAQGDEERSGGGAEAGEEEDGKRQEERLLREVLAEGQPMAQWSDEQKEAMIRYTLQLRTQAGDGGGGGSGGTASGAVRLGELMEACMSMYQSLLKAQQQLTALQAQQAAEATRSSSASSSAPASSIASSASLSPPASSSSPASSSTAPAPDLDFYVHQHSADQAELATLRHQLHQLQSTQSSSPVASSFHTLLSSVTSAVCALQLLYVGAWLWRQSSERRKAGGAGRGGGGGGGRSWWDVLDEWLSGVVGWFAGGSGSL